MQKRSTITVGRRLARRKTPPPRWLAEKWKGRERKDEKWSWNRRNHKKNKRNYHLPSKQLPSPEKSIAAVGERENMKSTHTHWSDLSFTDPSRREKGKTKWGSFLARSGWIVSEVWKRKWRNGGGGGDAFLQKEEEGSAILLRRKEVGCVWLGEIRRGFDNL